MTEMMAPPLHTETQPSRWRRRLLSGAAVTVLAVTSGVGGGLLVTELAPASTGTASATTTARTVSTGTTSLAQVAARVSPSVVTIKVSSPQGEAEGSGVVLSADGLIMTNNHVVESGGALTVELSDGRTVDATLVGRDAGADIAVIRAAGVSDLTPAAIGSSAHLEVGQTVLAIGSPLGLRDTVTAGIVSALDRSMDAGNGESLSGLIQTDAAINPGNSGGAIVDTAGQVVGIAVAIATTGQDGGNIGVGFAIPIDTAISVANRLAS